MKRSSNDQNKAFLLAEENKDDLENMRASSGKQPKLYAHY